jgi:hypothetical protein
MLAPRGVSSKERKLEETAHNDILAACRPVRTLPVQRFPCSDNVLLVQWPCRTGPADPRSPNGHPCNHKRSAAPSARLRNGQPSNSPNIAMHVRPYDPTPARIQRGYTRRVNVQSGIIRAQIQNFLHCVAKMTEWCGNFGAQRSIGVLPRKGRMPLFTYRRPAAVGLAIAAAHLARRSAGVRFIADGGTSPLHAPPDRSTPGREIGSPVISLANRAARTSFLTYG